MAIFNSFLYVYQRVKAMALGRLSPEKLGDARHCAERDVDSLVDLRAGGRCKCLSRRL
jgi:hypothetical protein